MLSIEKSATFQKEYTSFKNQIDQIPEESGKLICKALLAKLLSEVRKLDKQHDEFSLNNRLSSLTGETRQTVAELRKSLRNKITEFSTNSQF